MQQILTLRNEVSADALNIQAALKKQTLREKDRKKQKAKDVYYIKS